MSQSPSAPPNPGVATTPTLVAGVPAKPAERTLYRDAYEKFIANRLAVVSAVIMILIFVIGIFGPFVAPYDYVEQDLFNQNSPPSAEHILGTDELGRDLFSRLLWGGRTALMVAVMVTVLSLVLGVAFGASAAYLGGSVDATFVRVVDLLQSFPGLLLALLLATTLKPHFARVAQFLAAEYNLDIREAQVYVDYLVVFGALSLVSWYGLARLIRGQILSLRNSDYIMAALSIGSPERRIIARHLVPNAIGPVIVALSGAFGSAMLSEAALSFLGLGIQPPGASWGQMIQTGMQVWRYFPHLVLAPGFILVLAIIASTFIGDGLNDALRPTHRRR